MQNDDSVADSVAVTEIFEVLNNTSQSCPGFRSLRICADLQGSAKIVALNLEDPYRFARSLKKCADFL